MLIVLVYAHVKTDSIEAFKAATLENARHSVKEPGIARFDVIQAQHDPAHFLLYEAYKDEAAAAAHKETEHYKKWREAVAELMAEQRRGVKYNGLFPDKMDK
jgi:(4S)-4-hydroxy-5-phosphonooxypentane-2,3-dione isomerase